MDNQKIAERLVVMAKELISSDMDDAVTRFENGERGEVLNLFAENTEEWLREIVKKYRLRITKSDIKKAKKFLKNITLRTDDANVAEAVGRIQAVKDGFSPQQFNYRMEYVGGARRLISKISEGERFILMLAIRGI